MHSARPVWPWVLALLAALTLWRALVAALLPVTQDEAYYFDWARSLAWGYFDHPPGVALLGLGTLLGPAAGPPPAWAARLGVLLAGLLTLLVLARLYRRSGLSARGDLGLALLLAAATLPGLAGGLVLTPDTPLALCWALALHEAERALAGNRRRWLTAGVAVGLGLLSKYTMVVIGPVLLWAILRADPRALRTPWPWLGALAALMVFAPNLIWNWHNDWLALRFQFGHGFATDSGTLLAGAGEAAGTIAHTGPQGAWQRAASLLAYLGTQLGLWGLIALPLLARPWMGRGTDGTVRPRGEPPGPDTPMASPHARPLLLAATVFPLGFFALVSLTSDVEANWPAMYLLAAPALVAPWLAPIRPWAIAAALANLVLVTLYAVHGATAALPLPDSQNRILRETHGFRELASLAGGLGAPVYAERYQDTAMLRFYRPDLGAGQWPGLSRPSEYLRGHLAPVGGTALAGPFWLVSRRGEAPPIPGRTVTHRRTLVDCAGAPLAEGGEPSCRRPLHVWHLYRYLPTD